MKTLIPVLLVLALACGHEHAVNTEQRVRTATVKIVVVDASDALQKISAEVEANGGYVSDSRLWRDGEQVNATITLRVPADKLTETLAKIRGVAKRVDSEVVSSL